MKLSTFTAYLGDEEPINYMCSVGVNPNQSSGLIDLAFVPIPPIVQMSFSFSLTYLNAGYLVEMIETITNQKEDILAPPAQATIDIVSPATETSGIVLLPNLGIVWSRPLSLSLKHIDSNSQQYDINLNGPYTLWKMLGTTLNYNAGIVESLMEQMAEIEAERELTEEMEPNFGDRLQATRLSLQMLQSDL